MSFTETFGGNTINPAYLSYAAYTISANLSLQWPFQADDNANVLAAKIDVTATAGSLNVVFPDASIASVGQDALVHNTGANTFGVRSFGGTTIGSVDSGEAWYFWLTDNSTQNGVWESVQFGAGASTANAAALAGAGLRAMMTLLNQNLPISATSGPITVNNGALATVMQNVGGGVIWTFAQAGAAGGELPLGWFAYLLNNGTGNVTLTPFPGQTIDNGLTKVLAPTESAVVFSDGANLWTLGYGRAVVSTVTAASINVAGTGDFPLTSPQITAQVQDFTGALTGNVTVDYGVGAGYWFVFNNTSGAYTLTARVNSGDAGVTVTQGSYSILRSNGSNMEIAFTAATGTVTRIDTAAGQLVGGPITTSGTLGLATTAVTPGPYGDGLTQTLTATVDAYGRLTALAASSIAIVIGQVDTFTSSAFRGQLSDGTGTGAVVFGTSPTLSNPVVGTQLAADNSTLAASTAFVTTAVAAVINQSSTGPTTQSFTSGSGSTYTTPAGAKWIRVRMVGAGGGGGGTGVSVFPTGTTGGDSIFNSVHAAGGSGGVGANGSDSGAGGTGGSAGSGSATIRVSGTRGGDGGFATASEVGISGKGGDAPFFSGGGASVGNNTGTHGHAGTANTGGGGSGSIAPGATEPAGGGGSGEYAEIIIANPSATYTFTVGAGGPGGIGGNNTGGAGADGFITVEEHYNY